ncbi:hypothetical protein [Archangium sp.]|uniref:hypothetical protein n=1 Tax=Archangium sp. TaxID=1872627 RepID=UPI002D4B67D6|nr:hypothetical protein [Archangium sp.]HYO52516.1 hypothetical protein [Archangium sp.]
MSSVPRWLVLSLLGLLTLPACHATPPEQDSEADFDAPAPEQGHVEQALSGGGTLAPSGCLARPLLSALGKSNVLVGGKMSNDVASQAPFDVRYIYLAGGLFDSAGPCGSCLSCNAGRRSCANSSGGCAWWGCWQGDQQAPGQYLRDFLQAAAVRKQIPMLTYYELLHTSGVADGTGEVLRVTDISLMRRYFNDWRFVLKQIGSATALLHLEPDFWAYAQFLSVNPRLLPAAVASANPTDCGNQENSVAGMGRCLISMVRKYAPNAKVGLHASAWATKLDAHLNTNPLLDVTVEARKVADFLRLCGAAEGDFIVVEASDRDAQWYQVTTGTRRWWDPTNSKMPNFRQAFTWARALSERLGRPHLWWQLPVGNMSLPGTWEKWRDNRLDYFFDHPDRVAAAHGLGMVFGSGADGQTNPSTDNGHFVRRAKAYFASGGQPACPAGPREAQ